MLTWCQATTPPVFGGFTNSWSCQRRTFTWSSSWGWLWPSPPVGPGPEVYWQVGQCLAGKRDHAIQVLASSDPKSASAPLSKSIIYVYHWSSYEIVQPQFTRHLVRTACLIPVELVKKLVPWMFTISDLKKWKENERICPWANTTQAFGSAMSFGSKNAWNLPIPPPWEVCHSQP